MQDPILDNQMFETRRHFFGRAAGGIGTAALASLLNPQLFAGESNPLPANNGLGGLPGVPHFATQSKTSDLSFYVGCSIAAGYVGLQTENAGVV